MASKRRKPGKGQATPPSFLAAPSIIGTPVAGNASSFTPGTVAGNPVPTIVRQWRLDGADIVGETGATYTPIEADAGGVLTIRETATNVNGSVSSTSAGKTVTSLAATAVVLSGPTSGAVGAASSPFTVAANGTLAGNVTVNFSDGGAGGTFSPSPSVVLTPSETSAQVTYTPATEGDKAISISNTGGLANSGTPINYTASSIAWTIAEGGTFSTGANTASPLATSVPGGATIIQASPDLLPGQTPSVAGGTAYITGDSTVPTVNGDSPGSAIDAISAQSQRAQAGWFIEVMDSPVSPMIRRVTAGRAKDYSSAAYPSGRWNTIMAEAIEGDEFEIAPGAIHAQLSDLSNYHSNNLNSALLSIIKPSITLRNMAGRGRWGLYPDRSQVATSRNGICIYSPGSSGDMTGRGAFVLEGFEFDNWGIDGGVRCMPAAEVPGSYANMHTSLTLKNFKIGRLAGETCASGIAGGAETLLVEDGHVYDCGNGSGQEHNVYISARTMTWRGVRQQRTRGWPATPYVGFAGIEGHIYKLSAVTGVIEGCVVECAALGDQSLLLDLKAGGNWTVRGNLFIDSQAPNNANGAILMEREYGEGGSPNFEWWAGSEGNSLTFERNVWLGHYPRPIMFFRDPAVHANQALYASGDTSVAAERRMSSLLVRDNIAMVTTSEPYGSWMLSGFPGASNAMWILRDPNGGTNWAARGNSIETYDVNEGAFADRLLKLYTRKAGPIAANNDPGTGLPRVLATKRFIYPHGFIDRSDAYQGLA